MIMGGTALKPNDDWLFELRQIEVTMELNIY